MTSSTNTTSYSLPAVRTSEDHSFSRPRPTDGRSPCPGLNTLANHGFIPRRGRDIGFFELIRSLQYVYHITWPLALLTTFVGFATAGKFSVTTRRKDRSQPDTWLTWVPNHLPMPQWRLDLEKLSMRGSLKLPHNASFVHDNSVVSHAPDETLVGKLFKYASSHGTCGLTLRDVAVYHQTRVNELSSPLNFFHKQVAYSECGLAWAVMHRRISIKREGAGDCCEDVIPQDIIQEWLGHESLPSDWWAAGGSRPAKPVGFLEVHGFASSVAKIAEN